MPNPDTRTPTLLVLTRGAQAELRRKRLLPSRLGDLERHLYDRSLDEALAGGRELGCRVVVSCPEPLDLADDVVQIRQPQGSFGERFSDAMDRVASLASGPVLVVGTDTPGLDAELLGRALRILTAAPDDIVLGPAIDGGFYLLGFSRPLDDVNWRRLPWCSQSTRRSLSRRIQAGGRRVRFLEPRADLDRAPDLERWLASRPFGRWRRFAARLARLLRNRLHHDPPAAVIPEAPALATVCGRAPPR